MEKVKYLPSIVYMALIFYFSSIPFPEHIPYPAFDPGKHILHLAEYAVLSTLLYYASHRSGESIIISSVYGLTDEVHQYFVPLRFFDLYDLLFDCLGSIFGLCIVKIAMKMEGLLNRAT